MKTKSKFFQEIIEIADDVNNCARIQDAALKEARNIVRQHALKGEYVCSIPYGSSKLRSYVFNAFEEEGFECYLTYTADREKPFTLVVDWGM